VLTPEEIQNRKIAAAVQDAIVASRRERQAEINRIQAMHDRRERELQQQIAGLNSSIASAVGQHRNEMQRQSAGFYERLDKQSQAFDRRLVQQARTFDERLNEQSEAFDERLNEQSEAFDRRLNEQSEAFDDAIQTLAGQTAEAIDATHRHIAAVAEEHQRQIDDLNASVDEINNELAGINSRFQSEEAKAKLLTDELNAMLSLVAAMQHEKYAPAKLKAVADKTKGIENLPAAAVCALAHGAIRELIALSAEIERARMEYECKHSLVFDAIVAILKIMHENRKSVCFSSDNAEIRDEQGSPVPIELDFWSEGEYGELERQLETLRERVMKGIDDPAFSDNDLDKALKEAEKINLRQRAIVGECIVKGNASQVRAALADSAVESLTGQLFEVVERGYETSDQRLSYIVKLRNQTTRTDLLVVIHQGDESTENLVTVVTTRTDVVSEAAMEQRAREINKSLSEAGINIEGDIARMNEEGISALGEIYDDATVLKSKERGGRKIPDETLRKAGLRKTERNTGF
jgi:TolA-binding protein